MDWNTFAPFLTGTNNGTVNGLAQDIEYTPWRMMNDLLGLYNMQAKDAYAGQESARGARASMNNMASAGGRASQVGRYGQQANSRAQLQGNNIQRAMANAGLGNQMGAARLGALNDAGRSTNAYAQQMESPDNLARIFQQQLAMNDPNAILSIMPLFMNLDAARRGQTQLVDSRPKNNGGFLGQLLGTVLGGLTQNQGLFK